MAWVWAVDVARFVGGALLSGLVVECSGEVVRELWQFRPAFVGSNLRLLLGI